jgi:hypothetical protein
MKERIPILFTTDIGLPPENWKAGEQQPDGSWVATRGDKVVLLKPLGDHLGGGVTLWAAITVQGNPKAVWRYLKENPKVKNGPWTRHSAPNIVKNFIKSLRGDNETLSMMHIAGDDAAYVNTLDYVEGASQDEDQIVEV